MNPRPIIAGALALLAAACAAVGPTYRSPVAPVTAVGAFVGSATGPFSAEPARDDWWRLYQDPVLDRLVLQALAENKDLAVATANLFQVRALLRETSGARYPNTAVGSRVTYGRGSAAAAGGSEPLGDDSLYDVGLDASYEVDLAGRVRRSIEAAGADVDVAQAALDTVRVSVAAETARAYAAACASAGQLTVARRTLALQQRSAELTDRGFQAGRGTRLDVAQVQALQAQTRASLPAFEAQRRSALFRLAVLTGRPPAEISSEADACTTAPATTAPIPVGDGGALLARRPDVRQAERRLAAATARVGVATADLYPSITLGGSIGLTSIDAGDLADDAAFRWSLGPLISWRFPNTRIVRARIAQAEASAAGALAAFDGTVLASLEETESALVRYAAELDRRTALQEARDLSDEALGLARLRNEAGRDSFLTVLDADRTLAGAEAELAASEARLIDFQISLFKALAGTWSPMSAPQAGATRPS